MYSQFVLTLQVGFIAHISIENVLPFTFHNVVINYITCYCLSDHLCLWNTKYGTLVAKQPINSPSDKTPLIVSSLCYEANRVWVATNKGLDSLFVDCTGSATLAVAMGKQGVTEEKKAVNSVEWNAESWQV